MTNSQLNMDEVLQIAEDIERNGKAFYASAASVAKDNNFRKLFLDLAQWEAVHQSTFAHLRGRTLKAELDSVKFDVESEEAKYLRAVANGVVFANLKSPEVLLEEAGGKIDSLIMFAIDREKDSVIFYTSLGKVLTDPAAKEAIDKIVGEEISHIRYLSEILRSH